MVRHFAAIAIAWTAVASLSSLAHGSPPPQQQLWNQVAGCLSHPARILLNSSSPAFQVKLERWTDINKQSPWAIVEANNENEIHCAVKVLTSFNVPFVPANGGHSPFSTIQDGVILDLSGYSKVTVNETAQTFTVTAGVVNSEAVQALVEKDLCAPLAETGSIGTISSASGGGLAHLAGILGYTSDNIISARIILANGELITVSASENSDLFFGIRGAGIYFGLITQLTIQAFPLSDVGGRGGELGTFYDNQVVFNGSQLPEVVAALSTVLANRTAPGAGLLEFTYDPDSASTVIEMELSYYGSTEAAEQYYAPVKALGPLIWKPTRFAYANYANDSDDPLSIKGGYKHFNLAGLPRNPDTSPAIWNKVANVYEETLKVAPDANLTGYGLEWTRGTLLNGRTAPDTAFSHRDVYVWCEALSWYTEASSGPHVLALEQKAINTMTTGFQPWEIEVYQNFDRTSPLPRRYGTYGDSSRLAKLRALKKKYDPKGVFTRVFL